MPIAPQFVQHPNCNVHAVFWRENLKFGTRVVPCPAVDDFFFRQICFFSFFGEKKQKTSNGWVYRGSKNKCVRQIWGSIPLKRREHLDFCAENMCIVCVQLRSNYLVLIWNQLWALNVAWYWPYAVNILEYLREKTTDMPWSTWNRVVQNFFFF